MSNTKNWMEKFTNVETKLEVEAFSESRINTDTIELVNYNGYSIVGKRARGVKKFNFPLRIEDKINFEIDDMSKSVSKNDVINTLLEFALLELKRQNKTISNK